MDKAANSAQTIRFGVFEVDPQSGELRKGGRKVHVQDLPVRLLLVLLKRPGEVVTREELREALWPADTYVDFDRSLHTAAAKLREALGDSAESPRFLETVPRRGYRFLADVGTIGGGAVPAESPVTPLVRPRCPPDSRIRLRWAMAAALGVGGVALAVTFLWFSRSQRKPAGSSMEPVPLTTYPGQEMAPAFSPDGNRVAFTWNGEARDNFDIYVKQIGTEEPLRLTKDPARDFSPAWSPDGRYIAFARTLSPETEGIFRVPAIGGPEVKLTEATMGADRFLAWSADGKWLAFSDVGAAIKDPSTPAPLTRSLFLLSTETGERRRLTFSVAWDLSPDFSPDGREVVFVRFVSPGIGELYVLDLSAGLEPLHEPRRLTFLHQYIRSPAWTADGSEIVFASGPTLGRIRLWRIAASGSHAPRSVSSLGILDEDFPVISRQGRLAYAVTSPEDAIWRVELPARGRRGGRMGPFLASTRGDGFPQFSPDSRRIAFASSRSGTFEIWVSNQDGSAPMQLTTMNAFCGAPRWSPDGEWIAFDSNRGGQWDVYKVRSTGGMPPQRLTDHPATESQPSWSRDGKWIYFTSNRTGTHQIWKIPAEAGREVQVTRQGGYVALESFDGKWIYYNPDPLRTLPFSGSLKRIPTAGGEETPVLPSVTFVNFAVVPEGIYFIPSRDAKEPYWLHFYSFATGASRRVLPLSERVGIAGVSVSSDGRTLLYSHRGEPESDLMLVEKFK